MRKRILKLLFVLSVVLSVSNVDAQRSINVERIDSNLVYWIETDTLFYDSLLVGTQIQIVKTIMTKQQAVNRRFALLDRQKAVIESAPDLISKFDKEAAEFEKESGISYEKAFENVQLGRLQGEYTLIYLDTQTPVEIKNNQLLLEGAKKTIRILDRTQFRVNSLMGSNKHVTFKIRNQNITGKYQDNRVILLKKE